MSEVCGAPWRPQSGSVPASEARWGARLIRPLLGAFLAFPQDTYGAPSREKVNGVPRPGRVAEAAAFRVPAVPWWWAGVAEI